MKKHLPEKLEAGRLEGDASWGGYGPFLVQGPCGEKLMIVSSAADDDDAAAQGWEHVSVSTRRRPPNWQEMCFVKDLFWDEEECVVQFHPPRSAYVNNHPFCLHLWRCKHAPFPMPPENLVGDQSLGDLTRRRQSRS
jgi:hypothetical protein